MKELTAIVLAAGEGRRMKSSSPKVLHDLLGKPFIFYTLKELLNSSKCLKEIIVVVSKKSGKIEKTIRELFPLHSKKKKSVKIRFAYQPKALGTANAVGSAKKINTSHVLVICGDSPLITSSTLSEFIAFSLKKKRSCSLISAKLKEENVPGAILRDNKGKIKGVLEKAGFSSALKNKLGLEHSTQEFNSGIYIFDKRVLLKNLPKIKKNPRKGEYFFTDIIEIIYKQGEDIASFFLAQGSEIRGVNTQEDLQAAVKIMRYRVIHELIQKGVKIIDPETTFISQEVKVGKNTVIYPFTYIEEGVIIGSHCRLGPFIHVRKGSRIADKALLGNFLEINRSSIGKGSKIKHFGYIGDALIKEDVNIGAGCVVANYDGRHKHKTYIKRQAFIGSDTILVAPVTIGERAVTGAGSVVTKDVLPGQTVAGVPARALRKKR